jgi:hypothetical protein
MPGDRRLFSGLRGQDIPDLVRLYPLLHHFDVDDRSTDRFGERPIDALALDCQRDLRVGLAEHMVIRIIA